MSGKVDYRAAVERAANNVRMGKATTIRHKSLPLPITVAADGSVKFGFFTLAGFKIADFLGADWEVE